MDELPDDLLQYIKTLYEGSPSSELERLAAIINAGILAMVMQEIANRAMKKATK